MIYYFGPLAITMFFISPKHLTTFFTMKLNIFSARIKGTSMKSSSTKAITLEQQTRTSTSLSRFQGKAN
jgi:hypothetical protein